MSNKEIYNNQRNILNPNLGNNDRVQNNTASATSLIIRGDNSNAGAAHNQRHASTEDGGAAHAKVMVEDLPVINSFNEAGRSDSNYNGHESGTAELMNDGFHVESTTTSTTHTNDDDVPVYLAMGQRNPEPIFDPSTPKNVTALVGKSAYLNCRVRNLANKTVRTLPLVCVAWPCKFRSSPVQSPEQVSWIRHRDIHILTVGAYTYTSDQRFQATHDKDTGDWPLQIKWVQKRDKGLYECQVSTQPVMSYFVNLEVVGKQSTARSPSDCSGDP